MASDRATVTSGDMMRTLHLHFKVTRLDRVRMWLCLHLLALVGVVVGSSVSCEILDDRTDEAGA